MLAAAFGARTHLKVRPYEARQRKNALSGMHQQVGELRVIDLLHDWPHHDREHVKQALSITQAYVAEHMGNAKLLE